MKNINSEVQNAQWTPNRSRKKTIVRHIIIKLLKTNDKEKILKGNRSVIHSRMKIMTSLPETMLWKRVDTFKCVCACVLVTQSCLDLCNHKAYSLVGSSVCGILQARVLQWLSFPSPGDLPNPGIELRSPALQVDPLPSESLGKSL